MYNIYNYPYNHLNLKYLSYWKYQHHGEIL